LHIAIQNDGTRRLQSLAISLKDGRANLIVRHAASATPQHRTCGETDEIEHIGHPCGFVEIVDTPRQAPIDIPPGPEVLQMDVADAENLRGVRKVRTDIKNYFRPTPIRRAQKHERAFTHLFVLFGEILGKDIALELLFQPVLVLARGVANCCHRPSPPNVPNYRRTLHRHALDRSGSTASNPSPAGKQVSTTSHWKPT
jgi:hypothetical protein